MPGWRGVEIAHIRVVFASASVANVKEVKSSIPGGTLVARSISRGPLAGLPVAAWFRPARSGASVARLAAAATVLAPLAMIGAWAVAEALQPPSYSPLESSISGLAALGATDRWIVTSALLLVGACYFVIAACLPGLRVPARIMLLIAGASSIGIADSPQPLHGSSPQHLAWTCLGAVAIAIWPAFTASRAPLAPLILRARSAAAVTAVFVVLLAWLIVETQHGTALGLTERLVTGVQLTWPFFVARALLAKPGPFARRGRQRFSPTWNPTYLNGVAPSASRCHEAGDA